MTPQVDAGTDLEDELSIPASPPVDVNNEVVALSRREDVDSELEQVFGNVGSLPTIVTPVCDFDGALHVTPAECPRIEPLGMSAFVTRPSMASSPVGPKFLSPGFSHPSTELVGVLSVPRTSPVALAPKEFLLLNAADTDQAQPEAGPSFTEDLAGGLFPTIPLTPWQLRLVTVVSWTQLGGPRKSRIFLERGRSTYTRIICVPSPLRS